jgi:hypothetical protein
MEGWFDAEYFLSQLYDINHKNSSFYEGNTRRQASCSKTYLLQAYEIAP